MRISDWSSDVCSSDLLALAAPAVAQVTTIDPDAAIDADLNPGPAAAQTPAPAGELPSRQPAAPPTGNGTPIETEGGVADWKANQLATPAPTRSEEPTSELQSLMRISYAVFCLNKKTKRKKHHHL